MDPNGVLDGLCNPWKFNKDKTTGGKGTVKWVNEMTQRNWSTDDINNLLQNGERSPAELKMPPNNPGTRFTDPLNPKRYIIVDELLKLIIQISNILWKDCVNIPKLVPSESGKIRWIVQQIGRV